MTTHPYRRCLTTAAAIAAIVTVVALGADVSATGIHVYNAPLDDLGQATVYWTVGYAAQTVKFEAHFANAGPFDWLAVGFSDRGNHTGADFCLMWRDWKGVTSMLVSRNLVNDLKKKKTRRELRNCRLR